MPSPALEAAARAVRRPLETVRRRMRWQAALDSAARAAIVAAAVALVAVYLWRLRVVAGRGLIELALAALALIAGGAAVGALKKIPLLRVARRIDGAHRLDDRFGSALAFLDERAPTPFMLAAIDDAANRAGDLEPARAAPFERPRGLGAASLVSLVALVVALLHFPERAGVVAALAPKAPRLTVEHELLAPEREAAAELRRDAERADDPETKKLAEELQKLLGDLDKEELTRKQVFDKLAELESRLKPGADGNFDELKKQLRKAGAELGKEKLTREAGDALVKDDLEQAKKELEKLAAEAQRLDAEKKKDPKEEKKDDAKREELARSLERAARPQEKSAEEKKRERDEQHLRDEERRLKKELSRRPNDEELQRRLKRNQRELERLEREKQREAERERQLKRLQRDLQEAAEQLRQKLSPEAAEALRRAAQQLGQMENEIRKLDNSARAQRQIAELKEMLRRAGSIKIVQGGGQQGQGQDQDGKDGEGPDGQDGKDGKGKSGKGMMRDFNNRAGGEKVLVLGGKNGNGSVLLPLPMGPGEQPGGDKPGESGQGQGLPGDGIGDEHDPNLMGAATKLASKRHDTRVQGKDAGGPTRSETILGSAERGFATRAYRRVYSDYSSVVEEVMSKERVPPGYRYYIKRYFQLIKPRD